jgi:hypothetical protein
MTMTIRDKEARTPFEATLIKHRLKSGTVAKMVGENKMRINRLQRGVAPAKRDLRYRLLKAIRFLADDYSITEADLFPVDQSKDK